MDDITVKIGANADNVRDDLLDRWVQNIEARVQAIDTTVDVELGAVELPGGDSTDFKIQIDDKEAAKKIDGFVDLIDSKFKEIKTASLDLDVGNLDQSLEALTGIENAASNAKGLFDDVRSIIDDTRETLGRATDKADGLAESAGKTSGGFGGAVSKATRLAGIIALVATAAERVYSWVLDWQLEASGFNREMERALQLEKDLAESNERRSQDAIEAAGELTSFSEEQLRLETLISQATDKRNRTRSAFREAEQGLNPGAVGQFFDGKVNAELVPEFEQRKIAFEAAEAELKSYQAALEGAKDKESDFRSNLIDRLERERIEATKTREEILRYRNLKERISEDEAVQLAAFAIETEAIKKSKELDEQFQKQVETLRQRSIELQHGVEIAQQEKDIQQFGRERAEELAAIREANKAIEEKAENEKRKAREVAEARKQAERDAAEEAEKLLRQREKQVRDLDRLRGRQTQAGNRVEQSQERGRELQQRRDQVLGGFDNGIEALTNRIATSASQDGSSSEREIEKAAKETNRLQAEANKISVQVRDAVRDIRIQQGGMGV